MRQGYNRTPLLLRLFGYYDLLCDRCNLNYRALALPGTVPRSGRRHGRAPGMGYEQLMELASQVSISLSFIPYYLKLRLGVLTGRRRTPRPLGLGWRWRDWQERHRDPQP